MTTPTEPTSKAVTNETFSARQRQAIADLAGLVVDRASVEGDARKIHEEAATELELDDRNAFGEIEARHAAEVAEAEQTLASTTGAIESEYQNNRQQANTGMQEARRDLQNRARHDEQRLKKDYSYAVWLADTVFEGDERKPVTKYEAAVEHLDKLNDTLKSITGNASELLALHGCALPEGEPAEPDGDPTEAMEAIVEESTESLRRLHRLFPARLARGGTPWIVATLGAVIGGVGASWATGWTVSAGVAIGAGAGLVAGIVVAVLLVFVGKRQVRSAAVPLAAQLATGIDRHLRAIDLAGRRREEEDQQNRMKRAEALRKAKEEFAPKTAELKKAVQQHTKRIDEKFLPALDEAQTERDERLAQAKATFEQAIRDSTMRHERDLDKRRRQSAEANQANDRQLDDATRDSTHRWDTGRARVQVVLDEVEIQSSRLRTPWDDPSWAGWSPSGDCPSIVPFGSLTLDLANLGKDDPIELPPGVETSLVTPAALDLRRMHSLVIECDGQTRSRAIMALQQIMMRIITSFPPGKARFTIMDPVALGQNFAGFMHLADYDEALVGGRIWTDERQIEQKLGDLTEHLASVIQRFLRNEFETIWEYNERAGEIAEPFRFLVIADFPIRFNDNSAQRLSSIIKSGRRCGVYTLLARDIRQQMPAGLEPEDLEHDSIRLRPDDHGGFAWADQVFERCGLEIDEPPDGDTMKDLVSLVGRSLHEGTAVQVPFQRVAPAPERMWTASAASELRIALGRSGATKLQELRLGRGTSQHVLIAGKTGSGKSTLLHALVTNLALWYAPEEVELYLVDFKKGVEFKTYATHELPHAAAVAIESDREFGLSVLQRLDRELSRRGELFRDASVQDLPAYRAARPDEVMPRTLLIIDEFQEFFVEDDKLAQDASLLMDRLVRQGRAFGIHVILGSQTLGGAYSLARSTIGQMAVRIALQCSETDAHLIMSEDNGAARLLSRPGDAIYNNASGLIEGNSPFQVVWLPDAEREGHLGQIQHLAQSREYVRRERQIVFEGNIPAKISANHELASALEVPPATSGSRAWLGEAVAIKGPTSVDLVRQAGSNLLIIGQHEESARAMITSSLVGLAAQQPDSPDLEARFVVLDGTMPGAPEEGYFARVARALPHDVEVVGQDSLLEAMDRLGAEIARRQDGHEGPPVHVLIHALHRFRSLRRQEDSFGFSLDDEPKAVTPDKHLNTLLAEGAANDIHVIAWCDTVSGLNRSLDRASIGQFDHRALFQMSVADSSELIDGPQASRLGPNRALMYSQEQGVGEKFRPYAVPDEDWLLKVETALRARGMPGLPNA